VKPETVVELGLLFETYANLPLGSMAIEYGSISVPPAKGDPETPDNTPEAASTVKAEMVPPAESTAYRNFPAGSAVTVGGAEPAANGDPAMLVSSPVVGFVR
jgi:hypothetical protein